MLSQIFLMLIICATGFVEIIFFNIPIKLVEFYLNQQHVANANFTPSLYRCAGLGLFKLTSYLKSI